MTCLLEDQIGRIGLFGGTFNPPHWGHIKTVIGAADELLLNQVAFIPSPNPPHKRGIVFTPYKQRREMVELILPVDRRFRICVIEEDDLPGTTFETIQKLRNSGFTEDKCHLIWLMGSDSLLDLHQWHRPDDLLKSIEVAVMPRPGFPVENAAEEYLNSVTILKTCLIDISASDIRHRQTFGSELVPESVRDYISKNKLL